jgi:hypothetical protein
MISDDELRKIYKENLLMYMDEEEGILSAMRAAYNRGITENPKKSEIEEDDGSMRLFLRN